MSNLSGDEPNLSAEPLSAAGESVETVSNSQAPIDDSNSQLLQESEGISAHGSQEDTISIPHEDPPIPSSADPKEVQKETVSDAVGPLEEASLSPKDHKDLTPAILVDTPKDDQVVEPFVPKIYTEKERSFILFVVALASFLPPISTTIYLPALPTIGKDLNATPSAVSATLSAYTFLVGCFPLVYGPLSDTWGRKPILIGALLWYIGSSLICGFSDTVDQLIVFRCLQAIGVAALVVVGFGSIIDIFPPERRGSAMGILGLSPLLGPIVGPLIGGFVAGASGWRTVFFVLAGFAFIAFVAIFFWMPETLQKKLKQKHDVQQQILLAARTGVKYIPPPRLPLLERIKAIPPPWGPLRFLLHRSILNLSFVMGLVFAGMYIFISILPTAMASIYKLDTLNIGFANVPFGVGTLTGSFAGGKFSDKMALLVKSNPDKYKFEGRLVGTVVLAFAFFIFFTIFGYSLENQLTLATPLGLSFMIGFGMTFARVGAQTYAIEINPRAASSISASLLLIGFILAAIGTQIAPSMVSSINYGPTFLIVGVILAVSAFFTALLLFRVKPFWIPQHSPQPAAAIAAAPVVPAADNSDKKEESVTPLPAAAKA